MAVSIYRPTRALIHLDAITKNVQTEIEKMYQEGNNKELFAVVKANAYGHGAVKVAEAAIEGGASGLCVATVNEGIELRNANIKVPIIVMGVSDYNILEIISDNDLSIAVASTEWMEKALEISKNSNFEKVIKIHLKIDSGMARIGFTEIPEIKKVLHMIDNTTFFYLEGVFTHFATAESEDKTYWRKQYDNFKRLLECFENLPKYVHLSNSASTMWNSEEEKLGNAVRYGTAMYGLNPSGRKMSCPTKLIPAFELVSELVHVKKIEVGTGVSYGLNYLSEKNEWVGTIPIGYGDGWLRKTQGFKILIDGKFCPIIGRVCMDQMMIRLPQKYNLGKKVTLIGSNQEERIDIQDVADYLDTINYEIPCIITERVPRVYVD